MTQFRKRLRDTFNSLGNKAARVLTNPVFDNTLPGFIAGDIVTTSLVVAFATATFPPFAVPLIIAGGAVAGAAIGKYCHNKLQQRKAKLNS